MSATRSLRNRSSRYSSPATVVEKDVAVKPVENSGKNGYQGNLDQWIEPPVRNPVPSFEDTKGLERVGVLEHMAPLGSAPSQKMIQRLKLNFNRPSPRATPLRNEEVATPVPDSEKAAASPVDVEMREQSPVEEVVVISSPPRGRPAKKDIAEMHQAANITPSPVKASFSPALQFSPKPQSIQEHLRQDRLQNSLERAIREAENRGNSNFVPGFQRFRDDAQSNPQLWNVLDAIAHNTPTEAQFKVFKKYIKKGIRHHNRDVSSESSPARFHSQRLFTSPGGQDATMPPHRGSSTSSAPGPNLNSTFTSPFRIKFTSSNPNFPPPMSPNRLHSPTGTPQLLPPDRIIENGAQTTNSSPSRNREASVSSVSSLSSAKSLPEDYTAPAADENDGHHPDDRRMRPTGQRQAANRVAAASRLRSAATNQPTSKHPVSNANSTNRFATKKLKRTREELDIDPAEIDRRKQEFLDDSFHDYNNIPRPESNERLAVLGIPHPPASTIANVPPPVIHPNQLNYTQAALSSPTSTQAPPDFPIQNGTSRKRTYDEIDRDDLDVMTPMSSSPGPMLVPPPPAHVVASRAATPRAGKLPAVVGKVRKSARVMVSPNKPKNGGITAGISRAGPARDSLIDNGSDSGPEDNDEYCASCGGEGKLLCCDGCPNSFHHSCLEPPLDPEEEVEGEWYCPRCVARRNKDPLPSSGLMGMLIRRLDDTIPKAFTLPLKIRDYFEGVRTGEEGEYEEVGLPRTQNNTVKMNRAGFIDEPNYKELRDSKGNLIVCYRCGLTANGRDIIPCDYCPARWHLDCIDPPLAIPPRRRIGDKPNASWRCPLHVEHDLASISRQAEAAPGDLGRIPRLRRPKNVVPIDVTLSRGFRNNGIIEVDLMKDEMPAIKDFQIEGITYRIPEKGLRLDFIDRVKKSWYEDQSFPQLLGAKKRIRERVYRPDGYVLHHPPEVTTVEPHQPDFFTSSQAVSIAAQAKANAALRHRSFKEQQAVLNLVALSDHDALGYTGDSLADLTNQLVSEAPAEVSAAIDADERDQLIALQKLINSRLAILSEPLVNGKASPTTSISADTGSNCAHMVNGDQSHDRTEKDGMDTTH